MSTFGRMLNEMVTLFESRSIPVSKRTQDTEESCQELLQINPPTSRHWHNARGHAVFTEISFFFNEENGFFFMDFILSE